VSKKEDEKAYELAKELFLKKCPSEFLTDKTEGGFKAQMENAINVANLFIKIYETKTSNNRGE